MLQDRFPWERRRLACSRGDNLAGQKKARCLRCGLTALLFLSSISLAWGEGARSSIPEQVTVEQALERLESGDWILQWQAMKYLSRRKTEEAAPVLEQILTGKRHDWLKGRALVALADIRGERALKYVQLLSGSKSGVIRAAAVEAMGLIGSDKSGVAVQQALNDPDKEVRRQAIVALAMIRKAKAWGDVVKFLSDPDPNTIRYGVRALSHIGTSAANQKLVEMLSHGFIEVRLEAAGALRSVQDAKAVRALVEKLAIEDNQLIRETCRKTLLSMDEKVLAEPLVKFLRSGDTRVYSSALEILSHKATRSAADAVAGLIKAPRARYTPIVASALKLLARKEASPYQALFVQYLKHEQSEIRQEAVQGLAKCEGADLFALLKERLEDKKASVRSAAFRAIREHKVKAPPEGIVRYLSPLLEKEDKDLNAAALGILGDRISPEEFVEGLTLLSRFLKGEDSDVRQQVARTLGKVGDDDGKRMVASAQGLLTNWMLMGSFPNDEDNTGFTTPYPPELNIDFKAKYPSHKGVSHGAAFHVSEASSGGRQKTSLFIHPPWKNEVSGQVYGTFFVQLPERKVLKLKMSLGMKDGATKSNGVKISVFADETKLLERKIEKPDGWHPAEADLSPYSGKAVTIKFLVDPLGSPTWDWTLVGEPRILAGQTAILSLVELAPLAATGVSIPGIRNTSIAWKPWKVNDINGLLPLHEIFFPPSTHYKVAYGVCDIQSNEEQTVRLLIEADDSYILWLNGKSAAEVESAEEFERAVEEPLEEESEEEKKPGIEAKLMKGLNRFLIKVCNLREWWQFKVRVLDEEGKKAAAITQMENIE